ncbi:MAG TPA: hypothetical protein VI385_03660 [Flavisolibacter sp.]
MAKSFIDRIDMRFPKKIVSGDSVALAFLLVKGNEFLWSVTPD